MGEKKDKEYDAPHATCMAVEAGILPGGGVVLLNAPSLATNCPRGTLSPDAMPVPTSTFNQHLSISIILRASSDPLARSSVTRARSLLAYDLACDGKALKDKPETTDVEVSSNGFYPPRRAQLVSWSLGRSFISSHYVPYLAY